jgi:hypothetical protein
LAEERVQSERFIADAARGEEPARVDTVVRVGGGGDASGVEGWEPVGRYWNHARVKEMSAICKYTWAKSKKRKGRDVLSRISSLQRLIRTTARHFELHPSSRFDGGKGGSERRLSHDQVSSEMSLLHALTWTALGRTIIREQ